MIEIKPVTGKSELATFIDFPHKLYEGDKNYVPELFIAQRDLLTTHPFHKHSKVQNFLAYKDGKLSGRITAIINNNHNAFVNRKEGFFGFFDAYNDKEVAKALLEAATNWLKQYNVEKVLGPLNPTTNDPSGLLVEGFDSPPVVMMTYNKPYYLQLLEDNGFTKSTDLLAYELLTGEVDERAVRLKDALRKRFESRGLVVRQINLKDFKNEVQKILKVYNAAWKANTGFVPMTEDEFKYLAKDLKMILDKDFCLVAEKDGELVGFALAVPDVNTIQINIKKGRLLPTGLFKLLLGLKKIKAIRVLALGVNEEYRKLGIEAYFYAEIIEKAKQKNIVKGEASWILEHNEMMNKGLENLNARVYKRYRILEKAL